MTCGGWFTHITGHLPGTGQARSRGVRRRKTDVLPLSHATMFYVVFNTVSHIIVILISAYKWLASFVVDVK